MPKGASITASTRDTHNTRFNAMRAVPGPGDYSPKKPEKRPATATSFSRAPRKFLGIQERPKRKRRKLVGRYSKSFSTETEESEN